MIYTRYSEVKGKEVYGFGIKKKYKDIDVPFFPRLGRYIEDGMTPLFVYKDGDAYTATTAWSFGFADTYADAVKAYNNLARAAIKKRESEITAAQKSLDSFKEIALLNEDGTVSER